MDDTEGMLKSIEERDSIALRNDFDVARMHYKEIESIVEFYFSQLAQDINGPAIDKAEEHDDKVLEATGFQVVEELIFPVIKKESWDEIIREVNILNTTIKRLHLLAQDAQYSDENIFEAIRTQIYRIMSLGISGFDSPIALHSLNEAIYSLKGVNEISKLYMNWQTDNSMVDESITVAIVYLQRNSNFIAFNRAEFIMEYLEPLSIRLYDYQKSLNIPNNNGVFGLYMSKTSFFENIVNVDFFTPSQYRNLDPKADLLGKYLFYEPLLSGNNNRSCASCHNAKLAFTDGKVTSQAFQRGNFISRNAPTLINSSLQQRQFWDLRVLFLEDQIRDVVANPDEMHGQIVESAEQLKKSPEYVTLFTEVFGSNNPVTDRNLLAALASYIRSLTSLDSPFDLYIRGDKLKLTKDQVEGFNLFMGKAKCGTCHFLPLFNGTIPPRYTETESEVLGIPVEPDTMNATVDPDLGKYLTYKRELNKFAFKTPTVRNASLTAPYMHNGVYNTLEEVMDFYNRGGGAGIGIDLPNQTLPPDNLQLTIDEQQKIISFIHALTDTVGLTSIPDRLPLFEDEMLNKRKIGGVY